MDQGPPNFVGLVSENLDRQGRLTAKSTVIVVIVLMQMVVVSTLRSKSPKFERRIALLLMLLRSSSHLAGKECTTYGAQHTTQLARLFDT